MFKDYFGKTFYNYHIPYTKLPKYTIYLNYLLFFTYGENKEIKKYILIRIYNTINESLLKTNLLKCCWSQRAELEYSFKYNYELVKWWKHDPLSAAHDVCPDALVRSPGFLRSKDNEEDGKHASFNFANVYNERARDLLGKEINVFWKLFDGPYREMMRQRNIEYAHTITRFVSAEDFKYNSEAREFCDCYFWRAARERRDSPRLLDVWGFVCARGRNTSLLVCLHVDATKKVG